MERELYEAMAAQDGVHWWYVARRDVLHDLISRKIRLPQDARILEIGVGSGHNLGMLARFGLVDGHEVDEASRALSSARTGVTVGDARLPELTGVPDAHYDLVAILDVLEHVEDDVAALRGISRRLKPGGKILITVPQYPWMWSGHDVANHHFRRYTKTSLTAAVQTAGLRLELLTNFNSLLFPLAVASRFADKARGREGSDDKVPAAPLNALLRVVFGLERHLIGRLPLPPGMSLAAIVTPP